MTQPKPTQFSTIEEILNFAMKEEQEAAQYYQAAAIRITDPDMKQFLLILSKIELEHYNKLKQKLDEYQSTHFCMSGILASFDED